VEEVAHDAEYETPGRSCRVTSPAEAADTYLVDADPDLLRSAVENVVRNATRYTVEGTTVEVRLEARGLRMAEKTLSFACLIPVQAFHKKSCQDI